MAIPYIKKSDHSADQCRVDVGAFKDKSSRIINPSNLHSQRSVSEGKTNNTGVVRSVQNEDFFSSSSFDFSSEFLFSQKTHTSGVQVKHRAEALINSNHQEASRVREIADEVTQRWQQLVTCAEERHKLVTASLNFYKTAEQVCCVFCLKVPLLTCI